MRDDSEGMTRRCLRGARRLDDALGRIRFDDDTVLAELLLDEDNLFRAFDNKVAAGVERTFRHAGELCLGTPGEDALVAAQHDGQTTDVHVGSPHDVLPASVLNRDEDRRAVGDVA